MTAWTWFIIGNVIVLLWHIWMDYPKDNDE